VALSALIDRPVTVNGDSKPESFRFSIPDSLAWKRIRALWGDPGYVIEIVSSEHPLMAYCQEQVNLRVQLTGDSRVVDPEAAWIAPYLHSSREVTREDKTEGPGFIA
jgi:hypothetical protein